MTGEASEPTEVSNRWWIAAAVLVGTWSGTSLNSMMPIALPSILEEFQIGIDLGVWIISVFVLLAAVLMPISGWLGDRYGYRRVYLVGFTGVALSSWLAALATGFGWLMVARALQGIFDSVGLPSTLGIISTTFPRRQRGLAMGVWAAVNGASHGLGPVISGYLVETIGWTGPFLLNGSTAFLAVILIYLVVPSGYTQDGRSFDLLGAGTLTLTMLALMFNLRQGSALGWSSPVSLSLWFVFALLVLLFIYVEKRTSHPFIQLSLFANKNFSLVSGVASAQYLVLLGLQLLLSLYFIQLRQFSESFAGVLVLPLASTLAISSPVAGRIADVLGFRRSMMIGMTMVALMVASMALWQTDTRPMVIVPTLMAVGLGMGFVHSQGIAGVSLAVRKFELGVALGIYNMLRFISGTFGVNTLGIIVETNRTTGSASLAPFRVAFYLLTAIALVGLVLAVLLPRESALAQAAEAPTH